MVLKFFKSSLSRVKSAFSKTKEALGDKIIAVFGKKIDSETLEELEQIFYEADMGINASAELTEKVRKFYRSNPALNSTALIEKIKKEILNTLSATPSLMRRAEKKPLIILIVGANGHGKTTACAKLAKKFADSGEEVVIAATDTFRAAATEQLATWAQRIGVDIIKGYQGGDAAAVCYDALSAALARKKDVVIIDTAGRLHTKKELMRELEKIKKVCAKVCGKDPEETLLVLDATIGQNAVDQTRVFNTYTPLSGIILTKMDGTARGGIIINIQRELGIPVKFIGTGEGPDDLEQFEPAAFVDALF